MQPEISNAALLTTLGHLAERLGETTTPDAVLAAMVDGARGLLPFTACALAMPGADGWRVWRATTARPQQVTLNESVPPEAADTLSRFLDHGRPLRIDDLLAPPWNEASHRDVLWKDGTRAALLVPLVAGGASLGALSFTATRPGRYGADTHGVVSLLAWMVAAALRALPEESSQSSVDSERQ